MHDVTRVPHENRVSRRASCVLYEASRYGGRGAWIAFGRLCSDALRAYEGTRKSWAYIQWRQVGAPVPYRVLLVEVKRDAPKTLDDFDLVGQLLSYVAAALADLCKSRLSGWTVEPRPPTRR